MSFNKVVFPQFPNKTVFISFFKHLDKEILSTVKKELVSGNKDYDFCFLNTNHIISLEHLYNSLHKSILHYQNDTMKAKTLNTEIIFNLSPINNITDALRRFGIDEACPRVIVVKVLNTNEIETDTLKELNNHLSNILKVDESQNAQLNDDILFNELVDLQKFRKIYKLNDAKLTNEKCKLQAELTRLAIGACLLRGY